MTDIQLQIALAKELPELIEYITWNEDKTKLQRIFVWKSGKGLSCDGGYEGWNPNRQPITPREWDWIVRECEKKLTQNQRASFCSYLTHDTLHDGIFATQFASWQQQAMAYFKTFNKPIA